MVQCYIPDTNPRTSVNYCTVYNNYTVLKCKHEIKIGIC